MHTDVRHWSAFLDGGQCITRFTVQPPCIDTLVFGQVSAELPQRLAELPRGAHEISPLGVIQAHRDMNQRLQKQAPRTALRSPGFFQYLMTGEEFARIEQVNPTLKRATVLDRQPWTHTHNATRSGGNREGCYYQAY